MQNCLLFRCELLIAGFLYIIDFERTQQIRRNDPSRRRRIKRDLVSIPKKGVAGLVNEVLLSSDNAVATSDKNETVRSSSDNSPSSSADGKLVTADSDS